MIKLENKFGVKTSFSSKCSNELAMELERIHHIFISKYVMSNCLWVRSHQNVTHCQLAVLVVNRQVGMGRQGDIRETM